MKRWQDRISPEIKQLIDIDAAAKEFKRLINKKLGEGMPVNYASTKARQEMGAMLQKKGLSNAEAVHFMHVSEVEPYSGCGCCEHRRKAG